MLFAMPCFDHVGEEFGVNHRLVRGACYIITNNEDGFLAADRQGTQHVPASDHLLRAGKYYYHLARSPGQVAYLVVVDFRSWRFPGTVPAEWRRVGRSQRLSDIKNDYARSKTAMSETVKTLD
ncbi:hypothetical protein C8Q76DRAFT_747772 [Earliella scabrosa]|nr:hypothetical protein C8Q76DRAFT_747772 [Earliella scabrosa]